MLLRPVTEAIVSVVLTLTCVDYFPRSPGTKMAPEDLEAKASQAEWTPVLWPGRWTDVWSLKMALPQKLCGSRLSQKLLASVFHTLTSADCPPRSPGTKMASAEPEAEASRAGRTPVSGREGGQLSGAENGWPLLFYFSTLPLCFYYPLNSPSHTLNKLYSILKKYYL